MNQAALHIAEFRPKNIDNYQAVDYEEIDLKKLYLKSKKGKINLPLLLVHPDAKAVWKKLTAPFKVIKAAGGLVKNGHGEYLFIYRLGKWDLPKGKVDDDEKTEVTAVREVEEECGVKVHYRGELVATTHHMYTLKGKPVIKETKWYEMGVNKSPKLTPQKDEDITKAVWLNIKKLDKVRRNTYPMIHDLLEIIDRRTSSLEDK